MGATRATAVLVALLCATAQLGSAARPSVIGVETDLAVVQVEDITTTEASLRKLQGGTFDSLFDSAAEVISEFTGIVLSPDLFDNLSGTVGQLLSSFISGPFKALNELLQTEIAEFLDGVFPGLVEPLQEGVATFFDAVVPTLSEVFVGPVVEFFNNTLPDLSLSVGLEIEEFFNSVLPNLADSTIGEVEEFLNDVFPGLNVDLQEPIALFLDDVIGTLSENVADEVIDFFKTDLPNLSNIVALTAADFFDTVLPQLATALQQPATDFFDQVLPNLIENVQELSTNFFDSVLLTLPTEEEQAESIDFFNDVLPDLIDIVQEGSATFFDVVLEELVQDSSDAIDPLLDFFDNDFGGLFSFVEDTVDDILNTVFGTFTDTEQDEFADFLDNLLPTLPLSTQSALTDYVDTFLPVLPQEKLGPIVLFLDSLDQVTKSSSFPTDPDLVSIANEFTARLCEELFCTTTGPSVCGRNGITYPNECSLQCADVEEAPDAGCCSDCEVACTQDGINTFTSACDVSCGIIPGNLLPCVNISLVSAAPDIGVLVAAGASSTIDSVFVAFDLSELPTTVVSSAVGVAQDVLDQDFNVEITGDAIAIVATGDDEIQPSSGIFPKNLAKAIFTDNAVGTSISVFDAEVFENGKSVTTFFSNTDTVVLSDQEQGQCNNILGDFNDDGSVSVLDIVLTVSAVVDGASGDLTNCGEIAVDINGDNSISVLDVVQLVQLIIG